jgi:hypothetical protein
VIARAWPARIPVEVGGKTYEVNVAALLGPVPLPVERPTVLYRVARSAMPGPVVEHYATGARADERARELRASSDDRIYGVEVVTMAVSDGAEVRT